MLAKVQKWGNSLALRIPKAFADEMGLAPNVAVELILGDGKLVIVPIKLTPYSLDDLLAEVTLENRHDEIDAGGPVGLEVW